MDKTSMKLIAREPTQEMVDAARYRWLRNEAMAQEIKAPIVVMADHTGRVCYHNGLPEWLEGEELDRYIDAEIEPSNVRFSDAAPEIQQEPVAWMSKSGTLHRELKSITPSTRQYAIPLYAFPPDAQAEIAKRDERIESLTSAGAEYQRQCFEQAAEISRLREVVAKCKDTLVSRDMDCDAKSLVITEQDAEINRLNERVRELETYQDWLNDHYSKGWDKVDKQTVLIAKRKDTLVSNISDLQESNFVMFVVW